MPECVESRHIFFFQAEDGIRDIGVTGVQTCALPICGHPDPRAHLRPPDLPRRRRSPRQRPLPGRSPPQSLRRDLKNRRHDRPPEQGRGTDGHGRGSKAFGEQLRRDLRRRLGRRPDRCKLARARSFSQGKEALATIALRRVYDTSEFGVVEVDAEGNILGFQEKPDPKEAISTLANTGIYVLEPRALEYIPEKTFFDFARDVFPKFLQSGERFVGYQGDFYWSDIGTLQAYREAQYDVLSGRVKVKIPGEKLGESLWVGEDAQIRPTANIEGHLLVGRDAVIGRDVTLTGDVTVGRSEEHTSELQSRQYLVCRLLLEKKYCPLSALLIF